MEAFAALQKPPFGSSPKTEARQRRDFSTVRILCSVAYSTSKKGREERA